MARSPLSFNWLFPSVLVLATCGGRVDTSGPQSLQSANDLAATDGAATECTILPSTSDPVENCTRYCDGFGCACPSAIEVCEQGCQRAYSNRDLNAACLACALDHDFTILPTFSCSSFAQLDSGHPTFTILFSVPDCGSVCPP